METTQNLTTGATYTTDKGQSATVISFGPKRVNYTNSRGRRESIDRQSFERIFLSK